MVLHYYLIQIYFQYSSNKSIFVHLIHLFVTYELSHFRAVIKHYDSYIPLHHHSVAAMKLWSC